MPGQSVWLDVQAFSWVAGIVGALVAVWFGLPRRINWWVKGVSVLGTLVLISAVYWGIRISNPPIRQAEGAPGQAAGTSTLTQAPPPPNSGGLGSPGPQPDPAEPDHAFVTDKNGSWQEFARGMDGSLLHRRETSPGTTSWTAWFRVTVVPPMKGRPVATLDSFGSMVVFVVSSKDGSVWNTWNGDPAMDADWELKPIGGDIARLNSAYLEANQKLAVSGTDMRGKPEEAHQDASAGPTFWTDWTPLFPGG